MQRPTSTNIYQEFKKHPIVIFKAPLSAKGIENGLKKSKWWGYLHQPAKIKELRKDFSSWKETYDFFEDSFKEVFKNYSIPDKIDPEDLELVKEIKPYPYEKLEKEIENFKNQGLININ